VRFYRQVACTYSAVISHFLINCLTGEARISVASNFARCASPAFCSKIELPTRPSVHPPPYNNIIPRQQTGDFPFLIQIFSVSRLLGFTVIIYRMRLERKWGNCLHTHARTHSAAAVLAVIFFSIVTHWELIRIKCIGTLRRTCGVCNPLPACSTLKRGELMHGFLWVRSSVEQAINIQLSVSHIIIYQVFDAEETLLCCSA